MNDEILAHYKLCTQSMVYSKKGIDAMLAKDYMQAVAEFTTAIAVNDSWYNRYERAGAYFRLGEYALALEDLDEILWIHPRYVGASELKWQIIKAQESNL